MTCRFVKSEITKLMKSFESPNVGFVKMELWADEQSCGKGGAVLKDSGTGALLIGLCSKTRERGLTELDVIQECGPWFFGLKFQYREFFWNDRNTLNQGCM